MNSFRPSLISLGVIGLILIQFLFLFFQKIDTAKTVGVVQALLNDERSAINPNHLVQSLLDLKSVKLISCLKVWRQGDPIFLDESMDPKCAKNDLWLSGSVRNERILGVDGRNWHVGFRTVNASNFTVALWLSRALVILATYFLLAWISFRDRLHVQSIEAERVRAKLTSDLANQVAHDIRSPLSAINVIAEKGFNFSNDIELEVLKGAIVRINCIADDLLARGRTKVNIISSQISIAQTIESIMKEKEVQYSKLSGVKFSLSADKGECFVNGDEILLKRALSNIVNNGVESLHEGRGSINAYVRHFEKTVQIAIEDNGCGISPKTLGELGNREEILKGHTSKQNGNGLGLYHAKKIIADFSGSLSISSKLGRGTIVTIVLPRALYDQEQPHPLL